MKEDMKNKMRRLIRKLKILGWNIIMKQVCREEDIKLKKIERI